MDLGQACLGHYVGMQMAQVHHGKDAVVAELKLKLLFVLVAFPLVEIAGFVLVGGQIGLLATLGLVVVAGGFGFWILRRQAVSAGQDLRGSLQDLRSSGAMMANGALISVAAVLLILPGFLTDLAAILLLIPPFRRWLVAALAGRIATRGDVRGDRADNTIIDGTYFETDPDPAAQPPGNTGSGWTRH
jgi:UPF0716 protein FxsA